MGVRKRHPFTTSHVAELAKLVDKEIDSATTTIKDGNARRKRLTELFDLRGVITDIQDGDGEDDAEPEAPPAKPSSAKAATKLARKRLTKAEQDAKKAAAMSRQTGSDADNTGAHQT